MKMKGLKMIKSIVNTITMMVLTIIGAYIYSEYYAIDSGELNNFFYTQDNVLIILYIFIIAFISHYLYNNEFADKPKRQLGISLGIFKYVAEFIRSSSILIAVNSIIFNNFTGYEFHDNYMLIYTGLAISSIAISLFVSAKISLGVNYSHCYNQKKPSKIVDTGLYTLVRHPLYSSNILLILSVLIISGSYLILINLFLIILFYTISAFREEKYLINRFPEYRVYSKKTGMFIPRYRK